MSSNSTVKPKKILAVASAGGHWSQMLRLRPAFKKCDVVYVTTQKNITLVNDAAAATLTVQTIIDGNQSTPHRILIMLFQVFLIVMTERPDVIVSTGAAPGVFAILFGKLIGAKTLWLESIANAEHLSLSTKLVKPIADLTLTQWPHMAKPDGPYYKGSVL